MDCLSDDLKLEIMGWCDTFIGMGRCAIAGQGFAQQLKLAKVKLAERRMYGAGETSERLKQNCDTRLPIKLARAPAPTSSAEYRVRDMLVMGPMRTGTCGSKSPRLSRWV